MTERVGEATEALRTPSLLDRLLHGSSRTFALTIPLLPEPTRCEVTVAYLLFRVADTLEDSTRWGRERKLDELSRLAAFLGGASDETAASLSERWLADPPCEHDGYLELLSELPTVMATSDDLPAAARRLVERHTLRTIDGMASFVARERGGSLRLESVDELQAYCYAVAGIVGELLTELFVLDRESLRPVAAELRRNAAKFGEALQLVNILKDAASDRAEGRSYLPAGTPIGEVFELARGDLDTAARYCVSLERAGAPPGVVAFTALPMMLAWGTLRRVERCGAGSKLTRDEVAEVVRELETAVRRRRVFDLWSRMRNAPSEG